MAQWEQAGLATPREVVRVELEAKFVCRWKCEIGLCEIGGERLGSWCIIFFIIFFYIKKMRLKKEKLWSKTILSRLKKYRFYGL